MSTGDEYIYEETIEHDVEMKPFTNKEVRLIYDNNAGSYNNQILFSTQSIMGDGKWADFANAYIEIPFTMAMKITDISGATTAFGSANPFMLGLKDGSIQLVDSITLNYNGTSMCQQSIFTNIIQHYRILSTWSTDDLNKWGDATLTSPDNPLAYRFRSSAGMPTDGLANNVISTQRFDAVNVTGGAPWRTTYDAFNTGFLKRMQFCAASENGSQGVNVTKNDTTATVGRAHWKASTGDDTAIYTWQILLTIRLKDLHPFFARLPVLKTCKIDLVINFNSFSGIVDYSQNLNGADSTMASSSFTQLSGRTCPFMLSSSLGNVITFTKQQPLSKLLNDENQTAKLNVACGINGIRGVQTLPTGDTQSDIFQQCRMYVPLYEMNPEYEKQLLETNPLKTIYYDDFYTFTSINKQTGNFSALLTSGVQNPKAVILFPFFNSEAANSGNVLGNAPYQSMFDSAPGTTNPITLSNLQILVGGKTVFPLIEQYNFQQYQDEFSELFALYGGKSDRQTTGLITQNMWQNSPIYVANLARRLPQDDGAPQSVQISCTVVSKNPVTPAQTATIDIIAFVLYGRTATFNLLNGLLENVNINQ